MLNFYNRPSIKKAVNLHIEITVWHTYQSFYNLFSIPDHHFSVSYAE